MSRNICVSNGQCINTVGSYTCLPFLDVSLPSNPDTITLNGGDSINVILQFEPNTILTNLVNESINGEYLFHEIYFANDDVMFEIPSSQLEYSYTEETGKLDLQIVTVAGTYLSNRHLCYSCDVI